MPKRTSRAKRTERATSAVVQPAESPAARSAVPEVFTVRTLKQARVLANPLRLRILAEFVAEPRTTKQVAERLGEPATKLYRHVDALLDAGLLMRKEERQKRGTMERYLQAVATRFEVDRALFAPSGNRKSSAVPRKVAEIISSVFADTEREFLSLAAGIASATDPPIMMRVLARGSKDGIAQLRQKLAAWIEECTALAPSNAPAEVEYAGLIAFYERPTTETDT